MKSDKANYWSLVVFLTLAAMLLSMNTVAQDKWVRVVNLEGRWKFSIGDKPAWSDTYFNDKSWENIYVPSKWEDEGFNGYNGHAWYRTTFDGTLLKDKEINYSLVLGYIDDVDEVYFNGKKIGGSGGFPPRYHTAYNALRNYNIPKELINFTGRNVIAVRVYDAEIEGGIVSGDLGIYMNRADQGLVINLRGMWDFRITGRRGERGSLFDDKSINALSAGVDGWVDINVPAMWETQGFSDYDGGAWYRKKFMVPKQLAGEDIVVILGKIDDSDRAFLNGKPIGAMTDSWQTVRYYHVSSTMVKAGEMNTLIVFVDDPQGNGGIFEGPVGIMKQSEFTKYMRWR